jgi:predicted nuclease with TOPRIM domain
MAFAYAKHSNAALQMHRAVGGRSDMQPSTTLVAVQLDTRVRTACSLSAELARLISEASERQAEVHRLQLEAAGLREEASSSEQRAAAAATR